MEVEPPERSPCTVTTVPDAKVRVGRPRVSAAQPWAALAFFSFLLHFAWEMLHSPLYAGMAAAPHWHAVRSCLTATVGDTVIALGAYAAVAAVTRDRGWLVRDSPNRVAGYLGVGLSVTVVLELINVYVWHRWAYALAMPLVLGVGVSPLMQWMVVPPIALWLTRRHMAGAGPPVIGI